MINTKRRDNIFKQYDKAIKAEDALLDSLDNKSISPQEFLNQYPKIHKACLEATLDRYELFSDLFNEANPDTDENPFISEIARINDLLK